VFDNFVITLIVQKMSELKQFIWDPNSAKKKIKCSDKNLPKGKAKLLNQQTGRISQQLENWENRNGTELVQEFPKK
jgi:hypothetical protein